MTTAAVIKHWRKRAKETLKVARLAAEAGSSSDALFHCHLSVERALKAAIMAKTRKPHPKMHNLLGLAKLLRQDWGEEDMTLFDTLTDFAVAARYDDPAWARKFATTKHAAHWLQQTEKFLSHFLP